MLFCESDFPDSTLIPPMFSLTPLPEVSPLDTRPAPSAHRPKFVGRHALTLVAGAIALGCSSCTSPSTTGPIATPTGVVVSSTHANDFEPVPNLDMSSMPMWHDTTALYDGFRADGFQAMLRQSTEETDTRNHRSFVPLP